MNHERAKQRAREHIAQQIVPLSAAIHRFEDAAVWPACRRVEDVWIISI